MDTAGAGFSGGRQRGEKAEDGIPTRKRDIEAISAFPLSFSMWGQRWRLRFTGSWEVGGSLRKNTETPSGERAPVFSLLAASNQSLLLLAKKKKKIEYKIMCTELVMT